MCVTTKSLSFFTQTSQRSRPARSLSLDVITNLADRGQHDNLIVSLYETVGVADIDGGLPLVPGDSSGFKRSDDVLQTQEKK